MTAQVHEELNYEGQHMELAGEPLSGYLKSLDEAAPDFSANAPSSACWRGYVGEWEITGGRLYLVAMYRSWPGDEDLMDLLFPGQDRVFADWFSGDLVCPRGKLLAYVHDGYSSVYERELRISVEKGVVAKTTESDTSRQICL